MMYSDGEDSELLGKGKQGGLYEYGATATSGGNKSSRLPYGGGSAGTLNTAEGDVSDSEGVGGVGITVSNSLTNSLSGDVTIATRVASPPPASIETNPALSDGGGGGDSQGLLSPVQTTPSSPLRKSKSFGFGGISPTRYEHYYDCRVYMYYFLHTRSIDLKMYIQMHPVARNGVWCTCRIFGNAVASFRLSFSSFLSVHPAPAVTTYIHAALLLNLQAGSTKECEWIASEMDAAVG